MSRGEKVVGLLLLYAGIVAAAYGTMSRIAALEARMAAAEATLAEMARP